MDYKLYRTVVNGVAVTNGGAFGLQSIKYIEVSVSLISIAKCPRYGIYNHTIAMKYNVSGF